MIKEPPTVITRQGLKQYLRLLEAHDDDGSLTIAANVLSTSLKSNLCWMPGSPHKAFFAPKILLS
tara:strand:+ start:418 stop:612 length:195 start_codon:yes stop_codon:yes gene_type:complete